MRNELLWGGLLLALIGCGSTSGRTTGGANGVAGAAGSGGEAPLTAGTYAGTATGAYCLGFPGGSGCSVQITISGSGPTYEVTEFMLPGGISGIGVAVTQTGGDVTVELLTGNAVAFCPSTEYTGSGTVGADGASMSVMLTGRPCGSSNTVFISLTLTKQ